MTKPKTNYSDKFKTHYSSEDSYSKNIEAKIADLENALCELSKEATDGENMEKQD